MTGIVVLGIVVLILIVILILVYSEDYANFINRRRGRLVTFTQKKAKDRRKTLRLPANLDIRYSLLDLDKKSTPKISQSYNISVGGAQIIIYEKLKKSTKINMEIEIPYQPGSVKTIAEVVWLREKFSLSLKQKRRVFFAGIKFIKINPHDEAKLLEYIYATLP